MAKVAVRVIRTYDAIPVEAEWGDSEDALKSKVDVTDLEYTEVAIVVGRIDLIEAAVAAEEAARPEEPSFSRSGTWDVSEMDAASYAKAKEAGGSGNEQAAADAKAYEEKN